MGMVFWTGEGWGGVTSIVGVCVHVHHSLHQDAGQWGYFIFSFFFLPGDKFEDPIVTPYSSPPELPDVMKPQDAPGALPE